jgi:hypothetical protein
VSSREQRRALLVPGLARITRSRDFLSELVEVDPSARASTIIAALPDDTMGYVWDRLKECEPTSGPAALGVFENDEWRIALMWKASSARVEVAQEDRQFADIDDASEVSMFLDCLVQERTLVIRRVAARLLEPPELAGA